MTSMKLFAAAAVVAGLIASPALAKDQQHMKRHHARMQQGTHMKMSANTYRSGAYRTGPQRPADSGFWPADVAAGAVGGALGVAGAAVNTAGAIATAPFRPWDNSYAYDNSDDYTWGPPQQTYAQRNGFVCQPGTWFRGQDGQNHICQ